MSGRRVDIVRRSIEAWNRRDWDTALADTTPDYEVDLSHAIGPVQGVFDREQTPGQWDQFTRDWESIQIEPEDFIDAGEHVVVPWTFRGRGREGVEVQAQVAWVFAFRDDACTRLTMYQSREEALEAIGMER